jgi:hypothetical protein
MRVATLTRSAMACMLLFGLVLAGCHKSEEAKAKETARAFFETADDRDNTAFKETLTTQARQNIQKKTDDTNRLNRHTSKDYTLHQIVVADERAQVFFTLKNNEGPTRGHLKLRREEGEWRVYAMVLNALPGGREVTINFENPAQMFADLFRELPKVMAEGVDALGEGFKAMGEGFKAAGEQMKREAADLRVGN